MISLQLLDQYCMSVKMTDYWRRALGFTRHIENTVQQPVQDADTVYEIERVTGRMHVRTGEAISVTYNGVRFFTMGGAR